MSGSLSDACNSIPLGRGNVHISGGNPERAGDSPNVNVNWGKHSLAKHCAPILC